MMLREITVRACAREAPRPGLAGRGVGLRRFLHPRFKRAISSGVNGNQSVRPSLRTEGKPGRGSHAEHAKYVEKRVILVVAPHSAPPRELSVFLKKNPNLRSVGFSSESSSTVFAFRPRDARECGPRSHKQTLRQKIKHG